MSLSGLSAVYRDFSWLYSVLLPIDHDWPLYRGHRVAISRRSTRSIGRTKTTDDLALQRRFSDRPGQAVYRRSIGSIGL